MRALAPALRRVVWIVVTLLVIPAGIMAQEAEDSDQDYKFSTEELTQMLAPIALYPDALTAQILMASTYPLEVVEAERWRSQNLQLKGNDLDTALQDMNWDPSVKSICHFPDILKSMSDKLDQTRKLGDAFLGQEEEVMATIQELRRKAREQGNLKTTGEQKVIVEEEIIRIEPANPEVVYVPVYDPAYVYGPWWYPAYPPYYWYYPPGFYSGAYIGFGPGIFFGFNAFTWAWFDWPVHRVHIDINRTRHFHHVRGRRDHVGNVWRHNPQHRRGVAYRDLRTNERFGGPRTPRISSPTGRERRGYPGGRIEQQGVRPSQSLPQRGTGARPSAPQTPQIRQPAPQAPQTPQVRQPATQAPQVQQPAPQTPRIPSTVPQTPRIRQAPAAGPTVPSTRREGTVPPQVQSIPDRSQRPVVRDTPFGGIGEGSFERRAGERGGLSNRGNEMRQQPGGFSGGGQRQQRQGGGGGGGGGGSRRER